jgi:hypothetical protein
MKLSEALVEIWHNLNDPKALSKEATTIYKQLYKEVLAVEEEGGDFNDNDSNG